MSRYAWCVTTPFKHDVKRGTFRRYTYGETKASQYHTGYFTCTGEEYAPFRMKDMERDMQQMIRESHEEADNLVDIPINGSTDYYKIRGKYWQLISCGCMHDDFKKDHPSLAYLLRWHLTNANGGPMHYQANSLYHLENLFTLYKFAREEGMPVDECMQAGQKYIDYFRSSACATDDEPLPKWLIEGTDESGKLYMTFNRPAVIDWLESRRERIAQEYKRDMTRARGDK